MTFDGTIIFTEDYSFSRVLVPEEQLDVLGVCTHLSKKGMTTKQAQQYVDLARQAGVKFWRDELPWSTVEPAKGQYKIPASADAAGGVGPKGRVAIIIGFIVFAIISVMHLPKKEEA